jgi:ADP-ribose pyrophosphatase
LKKKILTTKTFSVYTHSGSINNQKISRDIVERRDVAAIIAIENDNLILVKQNRFPHGTIYEIPSGSLDNNETPIECAFRELSEETGYTAKKMIPLLNWYPAIPFCNEIVHCFIAKGLEKVNEPKLDDDEFISVEKLNLKKVIRMIMNGKINNATTIISILSFAQKNKINL